MNIELFLEITTEGALRQLEEAGLKYSGLYVDMNNKDERKYVKDNAQLINDLLKQLDRARIDKSKAYKLSVESEAKAIRERLEAANLPFSMLIDAHKHERAEILAKQKAKDDAMALALQLESDHDHALLMNTVFDHGAKEREQERIDHEAKIAYEAAQEATRQERERVDNERQALELANHQREADKAHVSSVLNAAKVSLMQIALDEATAKIVVKAIRAGLIANVSISY